MIALTTIPGVTPLPLIQAPAQQVAPPAAPPNGDGVSLSDAAAAALGTRVGEAVGRVVTGFPQSGPGTGAVACLGRGIGEAVRRAVAGFQKPDSGVGAALGEALGKGVGEAVNRAFAGFQKPGTGVGAAAGAALALGEGWTGLQSGTEVCVPGGGLFGPVTLHPGNPGWVTPGCGFSAVG